MSTPKVSVVLPVYNVEKYLRACLDSLLSQTFDDFELIAVNDCTQDASRSILEEFAARDSRMRIVDNPENVGIARARNVGMDRAVGEYIYFLDSDDRLSSDYLEEMVRVADVSGAEIVLNLEVVRCFEGRDGEYDFPSVLTVAGEGEWVDRIRVIHEASSAVWFRLYRREFIEKHALRFPDLRISEDEAFHRLSHIRTPKAFVFYGPKYYYSVRAGSIMDSVNSNARHDLCMLRVFDTVYREYRKAGLLNRYPVKMFHVAPYFNLNTEEKFHAFKTYFEMIVDEHYREMEYIYNDVEKCFFKAVIESSDYNRYKLHHKPNPALDFLLAKRKGLIK